MEYEITKDDIKRLMNGETIELDSVYDYITTIELRLKETKNGIK